MEDLLNLYNKTIIITGGAGWIGTAISTGLAKLGANIVIASRNIDNCINLSNSLNKLGCNTLALQLNVNEIDSINNCIDTVLSKYDKIDVLINNAAKSVAGYFDDYSKEDFANTLDSCITQVFCMCKAVIPHMVKNKKGSIINIASMYGMISPNPDIYRNNSSFNNPIGYGVAKAGVIQLTKYIAGYYGNKGIRCNSISPGPFPSNKVQDTKWFINELENKTMLKRIGKPEDLIGVIALLSSDASSFITGANINVDGGWTAW